MTATRLSKLLSVQRSDAVLGYLFRCGVLGVICLWACSGVAQPFERLEFSSPVLMIDSDQMFENSDFGKRTFEEFEARGALLATENRQIEEELIAEEQELTELRATMEPIEFRSLADVFDQKVQNIRREQDRKSRDLNRGLEERRVIFLNAAIPILEQLMREAGAAVVLERRSVFIGSNVVDITSAAIERLNATLDVDDESEEK